MSAASTNPQPLTGTEIKHGIAVRMTESFPPEAVETLRERIVAGLDKTCSLQTHSVYAKFKAKWTMEWWEQEGMIRIRWWVNYDLDDYGHVTSGAIGERSETAPESARCLKGEIEEMPPDRFRRETEQPIPRVIEQKALETEKSSFSRASRGTRRRSEV